MSGDAVRTHRQQRVHSRLSIPLQCHPGIRCRACQCHSATQMTCPQHDNLTLTLPSDLGRLSSIALSLAAVVHWVCLALSPSLSCSCVCVYVYVYVCVCVSLSATVSVCVSSCLASYLLPPTSGGFCFENSVHTSQLVQKLVCLLQPWLKFHVCHCPVSWCWHS